MKIFIISAILGAFLNTNLALAISFEEIVDLRKKELSREVRQSCAIVMNESELSRNLLKAVYNCEASQDIELNLDSNENCLIRCMSEGIEDKEIVLVNRSRRKI